MGDNVDKSDSESSLDSNGLSSAERRYLDMVEKGSFGQMQNSSSSSSSSSSQTIAMDKSIVRTRREKALAAETVADVLDNCEDNDIGDIIDESKLESAAAGWFEPLDIPKNFTSVNEIQQILAPLFQPNVSSTSMTQIKDNLWSLFCFLARDAVTIGEESSDSKEIYRQCNIHFCGLMSGSLKDASHFETNFYKYLPRGTLPENFVEWVEQQKSTKMSEAFLKINYIKSMDKIQQQELWFGKKIWTKGGEIKTFINTKVNGLWRNDLASGESPSGQLFALRSRCWPDEATKRSKNALAAYLKQHASSNKSTSELQNERYQRLLLKFDSSWYPTFWMTLVLCGKPAGRMGRLTLGGGRGVSRIDPGMFSGTEPEKEVEEVLRTVPFSRESLRTMRAHNINPAHPDAPIQLRQAKRSRGEMSGDSTDTSSVSARTR